MMEWIGERILQALVGLLVGLALAWLIKRIRRHIARKVWQLHDPKTVVVCVAQSASATTRQYTRWSTGSGQVRALALIAPHLARAYSHVELQNVLFPDQVTGSNLERDLIILGGPITNSLTNKVLNKFDPSLPVTFDGSDIVVTGNGHSERFSATTSDGTVLEDVGLILWGTNPFDEGKRLVLIGGSHTYGVTAAARYLTSHYGKLRKMSKKSFIEVVRAVVDNDHVLPPRSVWKQELSDEP
jgi:hypothetical protein